MLRSFILCCAMLSSVAVVADEEIERLLTCSRYRSLWTQSINAKAAANTNKLDAQASAAIAYRNMMETESYTFFTMSREYHMLQYMYYSMLVDMYEAEMVRLQSVMDDCVAILNANNC